MTSVSLVKRETVWESLSQVLEQKQQDGLLVMVSTIATGGCN